MPREPRVTVRDHLERLLADQRTYFERLFSEHDKHHERDRLANTNAIKEAREGIEKRLGALNELREEVNEDRALLVPRAIFDARMETQDKAIDAIARALNEQRGRQAAFALLLTISVAVIGAAALLVQALAK